MDNEEKLAAELKKVAKVVEGLTERVKALEDEFVKRDKAVAKAIRDRR
ncbi:hypothetical protein [Nocardioides panzhihuensis]|uniref:Uncharacterized protein n=1 Tax=Nocardioides panzhihuensis TaxID=860243 RepID=A0A7Z0DNW4_9ACTN|nr:hypothetical protein [Nocardioides panzhihuensis]NYI78714.1 hypothetical protein [Nocardioides panzhihuensis]